MPSGPGQAPDLVLRNARVITMDPVVPLADAVAVAGDRIVAVGPRAVIEATAGRRTRFVDCGGHTVVTGFIDAHCHLLAYASRLMAVDCSPPAVASIPDIAAALARRARDTPEDGWIRGAGYDESMLREGRHPTRADIDRAVSDHPVRLNHRSGHACVLNSRAMELVGITTDTAEPPGGVIDRETMTGEPSGLLLEMGDYLDERIPTLSHGELLQGVRRVNRRLLSEGVVSVQDATHTNSVGRWELFQRLKSEGALDPRVTVMPGSAHLAEFERRGLPARSGDKHLDVGPVKVILTSTSGDLHPSATELERLLARIDRAGYQAAVHAVDVPAVRAAAQAIGRLGPGQRHRIEHCSECPPDVLAEVSQSGALVVTQPGFVLHSGDRYLREFDPADRAGLYPLGSLLRRGVRVAAGSDAPVAEPAPLRGIHAAATRRTAGGQVLGRNQAVSVLDGLAMYTTAAAYAANHEADRGAIAPGKLADMAVLNTELQPAEPEQLRDLKVETTIIGGQIAWSG